jgi:hypothetical protein
MRRWRGSHPRQRIAAFTMRGSERRRMYIVVQNLGLEHADPDCTRGRPPLQKPACAACLRVCNDPPTSAEQRWPTGPSRGLGCERLDVNREGERERAELWKEDRVGVQGLRCGPRMTSASRKRDTPEMAVGGEQVWRSVGRDSSHDAWNIPLVSTTLVQDLPISVFFRFWLKKRESVVRSRRSTCGE